MRADSKAVIGTILNYSGITWDDLNDNFDIRLKVQKMIYLLKLHPEFSNMLPYNFNFYIRGPYSAELAEVYYNLKDSKMSKPGLSNLSDNAREYLNFIKKQETRDLELLASVIYTMNMNPGIEKGKIVSKVKSLKPYFNEERINKAYDSALELKQKFNLIF